MEMKLKITQKDQYHGAAIIQIAEHDSFTAINSFTLKNGTKSTRSFKINGKTGIMFKYASRPNHHHEYIFTFNQEQIEELKELDNMNAQTFFAGVCIQDRDICLVDYNTISELIKQRKMLSKKHEDKYNLIVIAKKNHAFRVSMNRPDTKGCHINDKDEYVIPRNDFPQKIFK